MSAGNAIIFRIQDQYLWTVILKFLQECLSDSWILVYCCVNSYFKFNTKRKLYFFLKKLWALKVAKQFPIQGVVAHKLVAYKKKVYINQLNDTSSYNLDRKTQSLCGLVPIM